MPQKKKVIKKDIKKVVKNVIKNSKQQPLLKNSININIDLDDNDKKKKPKRKNKKIIQTEQQPQQQQPLKQPNRKFGVGYMPSPDTKINNFNSNLIDMAMDKIKRYSTSLAPPLAPPQLPQQQPQAPPPPQIIQQYIPMPSMSMPMSSMSMPNPSAPSYAPSLAPSMPPSNFATPAMTPAITPVKPPQQPPAAPKPAPPLPAAAGKAPPPPPPPPPTVSLAAAATTALNTLSKPAAKPPPPAEPKKLTAAEIAASLGIKNVSAGAAEISAISVIVSAQQTKDLIDKIIKQIENDPFMSKEIEETGSGKKGTFVRHFNSLIEDKYKNFEPISTKAYTTYKLKKDKESQEAQLEV